MNDSSSPSELPVGYAIFVQTLCQGPAIAVTSGAGKAVVFETEVDAQREIVDHHITRLQEFLDGERDFDDAMAVDEYVAPVTIHPDGVLVAEDGSFFRLSSH